MSLSKAWVEVQFFSQTMKCSASPQSVFGRADWYNIAWTHSKRWPLSDSATSLCCGVLCGEVVFGTFLL